MARIDLPELSGSVAEQLLQNRFRWYARQARASRSGYLAVGLAQLLAALVIAVSIGFTAPRWLVPGLGAGIAFLEGVRTLLRFQDNYLAYRAAAEQLRGEAWLFAQRAGDYAGAADRERLLTERVVDISSRENAAWAATLSQARAPR